MPPAGPCVPTATVEIRIPTGLKFLNFITVEFLGGDGSPSLMTIMCLIAASGTALKPASAICMAGSNSGMSPGVIRSSRASIALAVGADCATSPAAGPTASPLPV